MSNHISNPNPNTLTLTVTFKLTSLTIFYIQAVVARDGNVQVGRPGLMSTSPMILVITYLTLLSMPVMLGSVGWLDRKYVTSKIPQSALWVPPITRRTRSYFSKSMLGVGLQCHQYSHLLMLCTTMWYYIQLRGTNNLLFRVLMNVLLFCLHANNRQQEALRAPVVRLVSPLTPILQGDISVKGF